MTPEQEQRLNALIGGKAQGLVEHAGAFMQFLSDLDDTDRQPALAALMAKFKRPDSRTEDQLEGEPIPTETLKKLQDSMGALLDATLNYVLTIRMDTHRAAEEILRLIDDRKEWEEKVFCLAALMGSNLVPHTTIPEAQTTLSEDDYQNHLKGLDDAMIKIRMASGVARNAPELADLVLTLIEGEQDREKKVTLFSYFILLRERMVMEAKARQQQQQQPPPTVN